MATASRATESHPPSAHVHLHNIQLTSALGPDPWHRSRKPQPVTASIKISYRDAAICAAEGDDVGKTLDYGKLYKRIEKVVGVSGDEGESGGGKDVRALGRRIADMGFEGLDGMAGDKRDRDRIEVWLRFPNGVLLADEGLRYRCVAERKGEGYRRELEVVEEEVRVEGIACGCVIGVNPHERVEKQRVIVGLCFKGWSGKDGWGRKVVGCYQEVTREVVEKVNATSYQTVEALASYIAKIVTMDFDIDEVTVTVEKPSALAFVERAGVEVTRTKNFFENKKK